jgi:hypothetical protein
LLTVTGIVENKDWHLQRKKISSNNFRLPINLHNDKRRFILDKFHFEFRCNMQFFWWKSPNKIVHFRPWQNILLYLKWSILATLKAFDVIQKLAQTCSFLSNSQ